MAAHNDAFGLIVRELRTLRHMTQEQLAFESGLSRTYISLLELGERSPTLDTAMALCAALRITLSDLFQRVDASLNNKS